MGVFGYTLSFPHSAELWSYLHPEAARYRVSLCKAALHLKAVARNLKRVQATAAEDRPTDCAFLVWLGFTQEGPPMRYAGPDGKSMRRYVWFPQED